MTVDHTVSNFSSICANIFDPSSQLEKLLQEPAHDHGQENFQTLNDNGIIHNTGADLFTNAEILELIEGTDISIASDSSFNIETVDDQTQTNGDGGDRLTGKFVSDNVINLSKRVLTRGEISLLSKGLKFCPTPRDLDRGKIKTDLNSSGGECVLNGFSEKKIIILKQILLEQNLL